MNTLFNRSGWSEGLQHGAQSGAVRAFAPPKAVRDRPFSREHQASGAPVRLADEGRLTLGALTIEPALRRVAHDGGGAEIVEPRVMQVLVAFVRAEGRILSRDELLARCWHGVVVGEDAITRVMGRLRRLLEGVGQGEFKLETLTKVGYRLVPAGGVGDAPAWQGPAPAAEPRLAVLAFDNLCEDDDLDWFSTGVSEEILQTVASGVDLEVIGRGSSFQFRGAEKSASHVAAALNVTHLLDGSVRRRGPMVRVSAQLIECASQTALWSDRFDRELSDCLAVQDEIARAVTAALTAVFSPRRSWRPSIRSVG
jgi:TolB-like protein/DNA-binding winged helix-turn-helix (wHTH) protein